jgi:hypothetical protein
MVPLSETVSADIILTPQFYTMKREALPMKYAYQAKRIAPSLFEGLVENLHQHDYFVYKEDEDWIFIAYNKSEISSFLASKGIQPEQVGKVFFAQQLASQLHVPLVLNDESALVLLDGKVVIVPRIALPESETVSIDMLKAPRKGIGIESDTASLLNQKQAIVISGMLILWAGVWFAEGWRYTKSNTILKEKLYTLYKNYPSLQNTYTRDSITQKYKTIDQQERKKRNVIGKMAGMIFKGVILKSFQMDKKHFTAVLDTKDLKTAKRLKGLIRQAGFTISNEASGGKELTIEGVL